MKYIVTESQYFDLMESVKGKSEITERCWKGYTQKGMKTMFGKRYPNCVKIKKKKSINEQDANPGTKKKIIEMLNAIGFDRTAEFFGGTQNLRGLLGDDFYEWASNNKQFIFDRIWQKGLENATEFFGGRDKLIELVGLKELIRALISFYNNPTFYGDRFYFICDYKNFDKYLDGLIYDADNQHEIVMDYFFEGIGENFKSILISACGDELKSFWNKKRAELCEGRLAEQLFIDEEELPDFNNEYENVAKKIFDAVFDNLNAVNDGNGYVRWLVPNIPEDVEDLEDYTAFAKNHYGRLWISYCGLYHKLEFVKTFLGIDEKRFYELLVNYLNDKFSDVVGDRPVRDVGSHYC